MRREAITGLVLAFCATGAFAQNYTSSYGREWLTDARPGATRGSVSTASFHYGPTLSSGRPLLYGSCGSCSAPDRNCMRKLIEFATYRPQGARECLTPAPYTPSLLAWFPDGSRYCSGDCGTNAACRDRARIVGGRSACCGGACGVHTTVAERPATYGRTQSLYREPVPSSPRAAQPGYYQSAEPPLRQSSYMTKPAAYLSAPTGYRTQPSSEYLPPRR